ncbi:MULTISPECIES: L-piperidine-6-carboxylate dehydrogenase [Ralstonia solanacearum species complex]|uniref:aldehyde dehydrogenase (NAD(+)) n=4 Tax=Ralstonia solanacearum TaxID=305 RepID=A0ABF7R943_RALSL|nr:aldehyde dehydrogenase family protein [Ralstonia solanacearum]ALF89402.1 Succinate-semialdehyde dehydrogenase [Ralstonia solanacearum]ATI28789.1 aldehyde dehydrogenase family protein [Ralstonia solanacearum]KEI34198.1 aldehyde dehydrogenase [Ralstonia solanacearum]KFX80181.1 aldehyde dehydrogenase [Ralstonia solanacearum]KFX83539.1 aldehyde dehydrogenase [Ralstonia solanacearum]
MSLSPEPLLQRLHLDTLIGGDGPLAACSPIDGAVLARLPAETAADADRIVTQAHAAFQRWRTVPAPRRGELVRLLGEELRAHKADLGALVTLETGKITQEGLGEVQEMIDICDFAVGLSRQLYGLTIASERPAHRMMETWHPLGPCLVITAFNFPVAVWAWNAALALVCGDPVIWKPSEKTPLTALAVERLFLRACQRFGEAPPHLAQVAIGGRDLGEALARHPGIPLVSATGSTGMGRAVAQAAAPRFARTLLELGGNNAAIVCASADLALTERAIAFAAMGTAGQRCTSLRRLFVQRPVYASLVPRLTTLYARVPVGDPREDGTLVGPLIDRHAYERMQAALARARAEGGTVHGGERVTVGTGDGAYYVRPALVEMPAQGGVVCEETFAPILYAMPFDTLDEAIALNNAVPHGLSSSLFTLDMREAERFVSATGSDCGIANVNIGPSGAEIGGAFGGEKDTGGGREAGSDAWKAYMRRATNTVNYGTALPLAQGIRFEVGG